MLPDFDSLWNYDQPATTESAFRSLLPLTPPDLDHELQLLTQIARAQGLQRQFAPAHATLDDVERRLTAATVTAHVRLLLERGRLFNSAGVPQQARPYFEQAWQLAQASGEPGYAVDAAHMLGILETPALDWNLKALALAESSPDLRARRWRASLCQNIGWTYHDRGDFAAALGYFQSTLALRQEQGNPRDVRIAHWLVARALRSLNRAAEALEIQQALSLELQHATETDPYVDEELGECLLALGRAAEAQPHFARAYAVLSQDDRFAQYESARLQRLRALAG